LEFEGRKPAGQEEIAQVSEEGPGPGRQFDQKPRNGLGVLDLGNWGNGDHVLP
jgi:hypothetical protein